MYLGMYVLFCMVIAFTMASIFGRRFEESVITIQFGIIVLLYIFYVFDILNIGYYIICIMLVLSFMYALYKVVMQKKTIDVMKLVFRPTTFIYVALLFLIYLTVRDNTVSLIDELHMWAALPKILFYQNGALQLKETMMLGFSDYIPGMPLYLYFLERLGGEFQEAVLYFGYAALGAAMLLPMCGRISCYRKWYRYPIIIGVLYMVPLTFYNTIYNDYVIYYKSLHIDAMIGITVGYAVWLFVQMPWKNIFQTLNFSLCLAFLALLKSSGIVFVGVLLASLLLYLIKYDKVALEKWYVWTGLVLPLAVYFLWEICLSFYSAGDSVGYAVADILHVDFIKEFFKELMTKSILYPKYAELSKYCTFATILSWMIVLCIVWYGTVRKQMREKVQIIKWGNVTLAIQVLLFVAGLYGLCVGPFRSSMPSYPRYICTVLTAVLCYFTMNLVYEIDSFVVCIVWKGILGKVLCIILVLNIFAVVFFYPFNLPMQIRYPRMALNDANRIEEIILESSVPNKSFPGWEKGVLIIDPEYDSLSPDLNLYLQRRLYFDLIDENIQISSKIYFSDETINESEKNGIVIKRLLSDPEWVHCDYIYQIHYIDDTHKVIDVYDVEEIEGDIIYTQSMGRYDIK